MSLRARIRQRITRFVSTPSLVITPYRAGPSIASLIQHASKKNSGRLDRVDVFQFLEHSCDTAQLAASVLQGPSDEQVSIPLVDKKPRIAGTSGDEEGKELSLSLVKLRSPF